MEDIIYEELDVGKITRDNDGCHIQNIRKKVIAEISLKVIANGVEIVSMLCLNQYHEEMALGFLYNEGAVNSYEDIEHITFNDKLMAVIIKLREGVIIDLQESLRSVATGCGKCNTYINPLKKSQYKTNLNKETYSLNAILDSMSSFVTKSNVYKDVGGVHSVLFRAGNYELFIEDIGRHNCLDKIAGLMLKENKMDLLSQGVALVSGRISSEIMVKVIRMGIPVLVSHTTPTSASVKLAQEHNVTLLGYLRKNGGYVYSCPERLVP